jgi:NADPH:quinone reductase-like Zn-dependent oxidoreductase
VSEGGAADRTGRRGDTVRAAVFDVHGGPEVVRVKEVDTPEPGPGQVRIRVRAASLNHLDLFVRRGSPFRSHAAHRRIDIAGEVDAVGAGVEGVSRGVRVVVDPSLDWEWFEGVRRGPDLQDPEFRVVGEHTQGGFAEYAVVPARNLVQLPDAVSFRTAAAAGLVSVTAWRGLMTRGRLRAGERVLITGGSGGVSTMAVQMARHAGARVFVLTSGSGNCERLRDLGAHVALDRLAGNPSELIREATGRRGVDVVLDSVGEALWGTLTRALAPGGRLVTYGATTGPEVSIDLRRVFWKQLSIVGSTMGSPSEFRAALELVFERAVRPVVQAEFSLDEIARAHELLEAGEVFGKLVVRPG